VLDFQLIVLEADRDHLGEHEAHSVVHAANPSAAVMTLRDNVGCIM
jgi:hypothetical protein